MYGCRRHPHAGSHGVPFTHGGGEPRHLAVAGFERARSAPANKLVELADARSGFCLEPFTSYVRFEGLYVKALDS